MFLQRVPIPQGSATTGVGVKPCCERWDNRLHKTNGRFGHYYIGALLLSQCLHKSYCGMENFFVLRFAYVFCALYAACTCFCLGRSYNPRERICHWVRRHGRHHNIAIAESTGKCFVGVRRAPVGGTGVPNLQRKRLEAVHLRLHQRVRGITKCHPIVCVCCCVLRS